MIDSPATPVQESVTPEDVKLLKARAAYVFGAAFVASLILIGILNYLAQSGRGAVPPVVWMLILFAPGIVIVWFARQMRIPNWWLLIPISIWPIVNWIAFTLVESYTPIHLRSPQTQPEAPLWVWAFVGLLPPGALLVCSVWSPQYIGQLFLGPPVGANIPGIGVPCGWPILCGFLILVGLANYSLWLGAKRWRVQPLLPAVVLIVLTLLFPAMWLALLGPAAVQLYKQFCGG